MSPLGFGRSDPRWLILILVLSALAAAALGLVAWFVLPMIPFGGSYPFADEAPRLAVVLVIAVAWGVLNALLRAGRNSADQARLDALDRQETETRVLHDAAEGAREAAFARLRRDARQALRRRPLADLRPRYLVVGPTASGKSAALAAADLNLPYAAAEADINEPDTGCRFLPSDGALYIDVAGDLMVGARPEWAGLWPRFLDLIRTRRPARPVDGVVLVVAAADLAAPDEEARADLARSLRVCLDEIAHHLRVSVPVYLLLSKVDCIPGFSEFFEPLGAEERAQIWGAAFAASEKPVSGGAHRSDFGDAFDDLVWRAVTRQLNLLHTEPDPDRRTLAFEFPAQLASLRAAILGFLAQITRQHQSDGVPHLRGVFLASARQDGGTVDMIGGTMSRVFALPAPGALSHALHMRSRPRAYFLQRLFGSVIPAEAGQGQLSDRARFAARARVYGFRAMTAVATIVVLFLMWSAYREADAYITRVVAQGDLVRANATRLPKDADSRSQGADFPLTLAVLGDLAGLKAAAGAPAPDAFVNVAEVRSTASGTYADGLRTLLVPLVLRSLEARLAAADLSPATRFECLKLYLLLGEGRAVPSPLLAELGPLLAGDWLGLGADAAAIGHTADQIATLADVSLPPAPMNDALVARNRRLLAGITAAQIGYEVVRQQPSVRALKPWRPIDHAGGLGPRVIARASGVSMSEGIDGLFTQAGLAEVVPAAAAAAETLAGDAWVFGPDAAGQPNLSPRAIQAGLLDLYRADYVRTWEAFLTELTVPPMPTTAAATDVFTILYGANAPIQQLLQAVVAETSPDPQVGDAVTQTADQRASVLAQATPAAASAIGAALLPRTTLASLTTGPRQIIARQFASLRQAVARPKDGQDSEVETALRSLDPLYRQLLRAASGTPQPDAPAAGSDAALVQVAVNRLPPSIRPYFTRLQADATLLVKYDVRGRAAQAWAASVRPVCQAVVTRAFPFDPRAAHEVSLTDFTQLFSPNGLIAGFRRTQLASLVDTGARPWHWRDGRTQSSDQPDPTLSMFERAEDITAAFFTEGDQPRVRFTMVPLRLDPKAESMQFDIGGDSLRFAHGPEVPFVGQWPPPVADAPATLSVRPEVDDKRNSLVGDGRWALFRLMAQGRALPIESGQIVTFDVGGRRAQVKVTVPTLKNPFDLRQMAAFSCPEF